MSFDLPRSPNAVDSYIKVDRMGGEKWGGPKHASHAARASRARGRLHPSTFRALSQNRNRRRTRTRWYPCSASPSSPSSCPHVGVFRSRWKQRHAYRAAVRASQLSRQLPYRPPLRRSRWICSRRSRPRRSRPRRSRPPRRYHATEPLRQRWTCVAVSLALQVWHRQLLTSQLLRLGASLQRQQAAVQAVSTTAQPRLPRVVEGQAADPRRAPLEVQDVAVRPAQVGRWRQRLQQRQKTAKLLQGLRLEPPRVDAGVQPECPRRRYRQ